MIVVSGTFNIIKVRPYVIIKNCIVVLNELESFIGRDSQEDHDV